MNDTFDILSIGAVLIDMVARVEEFPERDGESFVKDFQLMYGGAAANVAVCCSRLGLETAFSGKIGQDHFGDLLYADLYRENVHVEDSLRINPDVGTGSCYICVDKHGDRIILAYSGAADTLTLNDLPLELIKRTNWVHLSDLRNVGAIEALLDGDISLNFSMSPGALIAQNPSRAYRLAQHTKLMVASLKEMMQIFRCTEDEIDTIADELISAYDERIVVVTKGKEGSTIYSKEEILTIPAFDVKAVDTTGAGDTYTAGMLYGLCKGMSIKKAGIFATACSAICVQEVGARSGPKDRKEVQRFIRRYGKD